MIGDAAISFVGSLGADPDLRVTQTGKSVVGFSVAVAGRTKNGDAWTDGPTTWYRCTVWGDYAEHVAESLHKGDRVVVSGTFTMREFTDGEGVKRLSPEVAVDECGPSLRFATAAVKRASRAAH